jgi:hypothetical protein
MPGYSGTPLAKKLGIKDNFRTALLHVPDDVKTELRDALGKCSIQRIGGPSGKDLDFIFLFAKSRAGLELELVQAAKALAPAGMLWISWPKKTSGVATDLTEDVIRQIGLDAGLVDIKVCAVTDVWSGLKFVIPSRIARKRSAQSPRRSLSVLVAATADPCDEMTIPKKVSANCPVTKMVARNNRIFRIRGAQLESGRRVCIQ